MSRSLRGILLVFLALGLYQVLALKPFRPLDEPRHAGYALYLADGKLPKVSDPLPHQRLGIRHLGSRNIVAAANHPPLYYLMVALPLKLV